MAKCDNCGEEALPVCSACFSRFHERDHDARVLAFCGCGPVRCECGAVSEARCWECLQKRIAEWYEPRLRRTEADVFDVREALRRLKAAVDVWRSEGGRWTR